MKAAILVFLLSISGLYSSLAFAEQDYTKYNLSLVDQVVVPSYQALSDSTVSFQNGVDQFCDDDTSVTLKELGRSYHEIMDRWQGVQWLKTGPGETLLRNHRFQMWPDKHGTGARQTRKILNQQDVAVLEPARFAAGSVAVQGLPVVEKLLFGKNADSETLRRAETSNQPSYRCHFLKAISRNITQIASELHVEWSSDYRNHIANPGETNDYYESAKAATADILSLISVQLIFMVESKLSEPLGLVKDNGRVRIKKAESWRSERTIRNIKLNLKALYAAFQTGIEPLLITDERKLYYQEKWVSVIQSFAQLPDSIQRGVEEYETQLVAATRNLNALQEIVTITLSSELELPLGFNGLDGD